MTALAKCGKKSDFVPEMDAVLCATVPYTLQGVDDSHTRQFRKTRRSHPILFHTLIYFVHMIKMNVTFW